MSETIELSSFQGYLRADGRVGTRNYLGVLIVGNCAATAARQVADWFTPERLTAFPNVGGVVPFIHELGCGMEKSGEPMDLLRRTLGGSIRNPNLAGAVVLALGCERNNIYAFLEQEGLESGPMLKSIVLQEVGGTRHAIDQGIAAIEGMLGEANRAQRQPASLDHLAIGVHADLDERDTLVRAALGDAVDRLIRAGGTVIITDTAVSAPALIPRAASADVRGQLEQRIVWWDAYTAGRDTRNARSQRRVESITVLPHSGSTSLQAVFGYAHPAPAKGLVLMDAPCHEAVASTGLVAAGATLIGVAARSANTFGATAVPTVKLAADAEQYARFADDLDIDCSAVSTGTATIQQMGKAIFTRWLAYASGEQTCNEELGIGDSEFVPWPIGVFA